MALAPSARGDLMTVDKFAQFTADMAVTLDDMDARAAERRVLDAFEAKRELVRFALRALLPEREVQEGISLEAAAELLDLIEELKADLAEARAERLKARKEVVALRQGRWS